MSLRRIFWVSAILLASHGCGTIRANLNAGYPAPAGVLREAPSVDSLAVQRFEDARPPRVYSTPGKLFLTYVPLIPYVARQFERVDESALKSVEEANLVVPPWNQIAYPVTMAQAIAADLSASGVFRTVDYVDDGPTGGHRYVLSGVLRATPVENDATSFGLGIVGVYFWILPVPIGQTWASITLDLTLTDTTTGKPIWQKTVQHEYAKWFNLYTSAPSLVYPKYGFEFVQLPRSAPVDRDSLFSWNFEVLRQAMEPVRDEIAAAVAERP